MFCAEIQAIREKPSEIARRQTKVTNVTLVTPDALAIRVILVK